MQDLLDTVAQQGHSNLFFAYVNFVEALRIAVSYLLVIIGYTYVIFSALHLLLYIVMSIKIGITNSPPAATSCALKPECPQRGFGVDMANMVCRFLQLNCTLVLYPSSDYGDADETGNATGLIGEIQRGKMDLSLPIMGPTYRRSKAVAFSMSYFYTGVALATRAPKANSNSDWNLLIVFQWPIISLFFISLIIISSLIKLRNSTLFIPKRNSQEKNLMRYALAFIETCSSLVTKKHDSSLSHFNSIRTMVSFWELAAIVLGSAYTGVLFSQKVVQTNQPPYVDMETFTKCLENRVCRLVQPSKQVSFHLQLTAPGSPLSTRINKALEYNPLVVVAKEKIMKAILEENDVYLVWFWPKEQMLYGANGDDCDFYIIDTPYTNAGSFAMRKIFKTMNALNNAALTFRENGLADVVLRKYGKPTSCNDRRNRDHGLTSWSEEGNGLYAFRTIFYLYAICLLCAVVALAVESGFYYWRKKPFSENHCDTLFTM